MPNKCFKPTVPPPAGLRLKLGVGRQMATENPIYRRWTPPFETRVPDIHGCLQDIQSSQELATRLLAELNAENPDPVLLDALSTATLVRYSRCFTSGIRVRLSIEELPTATPADVELHERLRGIRDWHIAHPINKQEVHALYVILDGSPTAMTGAIGFSSFSSVESPLEPSQASAMLELCVKWTDWLKIQLVHAQEPLIPYANRLSRAELLALPQDEPRPNSNIRAKRTQVQR